MRLKSALIAIVLFAISINLSFAQFNVLGRVQNSVNNEANKKIDQEVHDAFNKKEQRRKDSINKIQNNNNTNTTQPNNTATNEGDMGTYAHYDFVPGDTIIFEDDVKDEQAEEFPSKWRLGGGKLEVRKVNGENVIAFLEGNAVTICPRMKHDNYLPARYTIEYDFYSTTTGSLSSSFIAFKDRANSKSAGATGDFNSQIEISVDGQKMKNCTGKYSSRNDMVNKWYHVAIAVNERSIKVYVNQEKVLNCPVDGAAHGITFGTFAGPKDIKYLKNFRMAAGGKDPYKQITTDGRIICHGIKFDFDKATLKPESMGEINRIYNLMKDHTDLKFEIGGHTDSDGQEAHNQKLSQQRAESVKAQLISMGIDASRLTIKGYGASKPLSDNDSPEGKANNRRVEFVRM